MSNPRQFYSILPDLQSEVGHSYEYSLCVGKVVTSHGWDYFAWIPKQCSLRELPSGWQKILGSSRPFWSYFFAIRKLDPNVEAIFFLESAGFIATLIFCSALLLSGRRGSVWLMHRYAPSQMCSKGRWHAHLFRMLEKRMPLQFFTDSELLLEQQLKILASKIHLLPIPHAHMSGQGPFLKQDQRLHCWWPGGQIRAAKGLKEVQKLSQILQSNRYPIRLVIAKKAQQAGIMSSDSVLFIDDELDRVDYEKWMRTVDVVLLPYDPSVYHSGTSGIFVEAVSAGTLPIVRKGTWLAHELNKYGLSELIVDWEDDALSERLLALHQSVTVRTKLVFMQADYQRIHSLASFSEILGQCLKNS